MCQSVPTDHSIVEHHFSSLLLYLGRFNCQAYRECVRGRFTLQCLLMHKYCILVVFSSVTFREGWKHKSETRSTQTVFFPKDTF